MFIVGGPALIVGIMGFLVKAAITVAIIVLIIKGIKYLNRAETRNKDRDYRDAQATIDDIEQELNSRKD